MSAAIKIALEGELTIYRAAELQQQLLSSLLGDQTSLEIDLSGVTDLDSSGVQLLMAAKRAVAMTGKSLVLSRHSQAVVDVFELMDVAAFFGDPLLLSSPLSPEGCA